VSTIQVLLFFHILAAFLIAAGSALSVVVSAATRRAARTETIQTLLAASSKAPLLIVPGSLLAIVTGSWLVREAGYSYTEPWVVAAYIGWLVAGFLGGNVLGGYQRRLQALAARELSAGRSESPALLAAVNDPKIVAVEYVQVALVLGFLALMVFKPGH
jgi:uncharacterized membrane protein